MVPIEGVRVLGEMKFDLVRGVNFTGEVFEEGFAIGESNGRDAVGKGGLDVLGVLKTVVFYEENEGLESVEITLLGTKRGLDPGGKGVVGAEVDFIFRLGDLVELAPHCEVT